MQAIIVVRAAALAQATAVAKQLDAIGGANTFNVPLTTAAQSPTPVAYWCSWDFTPREIALIRARLNVTNQGGGKYTAGAGPNVAFYDATQWTPAQVLTDLGLQIVPQTRL